MDIPEIHLRANSLEIELNQAPHILHEPQCVKLYNKATLPRKFNFGLS